MASKITVKNQKVIMKNSESKAFTTKASVIPKIQMPVPTRIQGRMEMQFLMLS